MTAPEPVDRLRAALEQQNASDRLQAAMTAGTHPDPSYVDALVERFAAEPDFSVRETLTWALTRHPVDVTMPRLLAEAVSSTGRALSQTLHTLSKIGHPDAWRVVTPDLLADADDTIARTAWRTAVIVAPIEERAALAAILATQLARGGREVRLSLSRALVELGPDADPALASAAESDDPEVRVHAIATLQMIRDPDEGFDAAVFEARRLDAARHAPS